ncbi:MAG TPA: hypothetical protein PLP33_27175 [Leptospiraceae bacterium]|nr:hypothetical protein [Leptospiraceae bacterium]
MKKIKDDKKYWMTDYFVGNSRYSSYVIAENELIAKALLNLRGLNENITSSAVKVRQGYRILKVSVDYRKRNLISCLHTLSFVGNIALNAKIINHQELLLDNGLIHEVLHELQFEEFTFNKQVHEKLKNSIP